MIDITGEPQIFFDRVDEGDDEWQKVLEDPFGKVEFMLVDRSDAGRIQAQYPGVQDGDVPFLEPVAQNDRYVLLRVVGSPKPSSRCRRWRRFLEQVRGARRRRRAPGSASGRTVPVNWPSSMISTGWPSSSPTPSSRIAASLTSTQAVERAGRGRVTAALCARTREWDRSRRDRARLLATSHLRPAGAFGGRARGESWASSPTRAAA